MNDLGINTILGPIATHFIDVIHWRLSHTPFEYPCHHDYGRDSYVLYIPPRSMPEFSVEFSVGPKKQHTVIAIQRVVIVYSFLPY